MTSSTLLCQFLSVLHFLFPKKAENISAGKKKYENEGVEQNQVKRSDSQQKIVLGKNHDKIVSFYKDMLKQLKETTKERGDRV